MMMMMRSVRGLPPQLRGRPRWLSTENLPPPVTTSIQPAAAAATGPFGGRDGGTVSGSTAEGWEDVRAAFEHNFADNLELGAQLTIYQEGAPVVDLHGHAEGLPQGLGYGAHTLQNIFSSGKNLEAIACMLLVDRGLMQYEDKIAKHWPAFGQHGKDGITVEDVLRHESGLQFFVDPEHPDDFTKTFVPTVAEVAAEGAVERIIESSGTWGYGKRMYHASTRGFIIGGLIRQLSGQTLGQFIRTEIAEPLSVDVLCGTPIDVQACYEYAELKSVGFGYTLMQEVLPALMGRGGNAETVATFKWLASALTTCKHPLGAYPKSIPAEWGKDDKHHVQTPEGRTLEVSSGGIQSNARSLAKLSAMLANGGEVDGVRLVSAETVRLATSSPKVLRDDVWKMTYANTQGGFADFGTFVELLGMPNEVAAEAQKGFQGWAGKGGSLFLFDTDRKLGLAYTMNGMMNGGAGGPRTARILEVLRHK